MRFTKSDTELAKRKSRGGAFGDAGDAGDASDVGTAADAALVPASVTASGAEWAKRFMEGLKRLALRLRCGYATCCWNGFRVLSAKTTVELVPWLVLAIDPYRAGQAVARARAHNTEVSFWRSLWSERRRQARGSVTDTRCARENIFGEYLHVTCTECEIAES